MINIMRNKIYIIIAAFLVLSPGNLFSSQQDTPLTASVSVNSVFKISLQTTMLDFGAVEPGSSSARKDVIVSCSTNNNRAWSVSIGVRAPLTFESYEIANSNFKWNATLQNGGGQITGAGQMNTTPIDFYVAGTDDYITEDPVNLNLSLYVDVPSGQVAGKYTTVVLITMHEV